MIIGPGTPVLQMIDEIVDCVLQRLSPDIQCMLILLCFFLYDFQIFFSGGR